MRLVFSWCMVLAVLFASASIVAAAGDEPVDYVQDIKPILARRCYACHGALKQKNNLRLDTAALAIQGGDGGPAVVAGNVAESLLLDAVTGANGVAKMPPEGEPLKPEEVDVLRRWIEAGAKAPPEKPPEDPARHWSYQPPVRPPVPHVANAAWVRNPIDAFVGAMHEKQGVRASPEAARHVLLRRVYLDLIGLPPTRAEMEAFLADATDGAFERVVDRLLESPRYGERWGRHWMDVWRYSDWDGFGAEVRESQPHIWRWRDWIIESVNADKPYDRMILEMLAGDELAPDDPETIRATGFLVRNWYKFNRNVWLDFTIEHTAKGFLGTTLNCARCHDHMYDPLSQEDYYRFRAIFEPHTIRTDRVPGQADTAKDGLARVFDEKADAPTFLFTRGDEKRPDKDQPLPAAVPAVLSRSPFQVEPVALHPAAAYPGLRPWVQAEQRTQSQSSVTAARTAWGDANSRLVAARKKQADAVAAKVAPQEKVEAAGRVVLSDDFSAAKPELWTMGEGQWAYQDSRLVQSDPRDALTQILSVPPHPADLLAKFRFKTTGGDVYKSVGLSFDAVEDKSCWAVYLSGVGKLSIFQRVDGRDVYFADGARDFPVELNREYELLVAVRGNLLNVAVDGKLQFVYRLPGERLKEGRLALWTYDATAEFLGASLHELPAEFVLFEQIGVPPASLSDPELQQEIAAAEAALTLADRSLAAARAHTSWVEARIAADQAAFAAPPAADARDLALAAGAAEREHTLRVAERNALEAAQKLAAARAALKPDDEKTKKPVTDAEAAQSAATKALHEAQAALAEPLEAYTRFTPVYPTTTTGRRLALARWIADARNPLTARVAINHVWLRHFGAPLVPTVFDFGLNGKPPTHPELLDWLAVELMEPTQSAATPWRLKHIHRLIVTSAAYRQQSGGAGPDTEVNRRIDPDNVWLWRMNLRRMEAEIVRDSTLHVAGSLDTTMAGPELDENAGMTVGRRSVYFRNSKEKKMTFLDLFDRPNVVECYRRSESIVPQQALALANSPLSLAQSRVLAKKLTEELGSAFGPESSRAFIATAFAQTLNRPPSEAERTECEKFLIEQSQRFANPQGLTQFTAGAASPVPPAADPQQRARENLIHVLFNHNDFLTVR